MKSLRSRPFAIIALVLLTTAANAQKKKKDIQPLIDSQSYVFEVEWIKPLTGAPKLDAGSYTLVVTKDTVIAYLPFFGTVYQEPVVKTSPEIKFITTKFNYEKETTDKGWNISIKPKWRGNSDLFFLTIYKNGRAKLQVNSSTRESISYTGFIRALDPFETDNYYE
jgi:hypothetical protein